MELTSICEWSGKMFFKWEGRIDEGLKSKRIHQVIRNVERKRIETASKRTFALVGFESDEGVKRNQGRIGAAKAPNKIRKFLANIPYHHTEDNIVDIGNITCRDGQLEIAQTNLAAEITHLLKHHYTPIILGGGHETFYGHYLGVRNALGKEPTIGMINLDAHFDIRFANVPTSGTMFHQVLTEDRNSNYLCIGIQKLGNTEQHFSEAKKLNVTYILEDEIFPIEKTLEVIDTFANRHDYIIYTICTDVINQAFAPGVSAPAPFGIEPHVVRLLSKHIVTKQNFLSVDVSEVNPDYDVADITVRLVSYLIAEMMMHVNEMGNEHD